MKKFIILSLLVLPSCSQLSIVTSSIGVAASTSVVAKTYSGVDLITIMKTDQSIKEHIKNNIEASLTPKNKERVEKVKEKVIELKERNYVVYLP
tara:strand:+ start:96 stop:377 length:282 start_codon:yes stop_codon:yes gene_type:complete